MTQPSITVFENHQIRKTKKQKTAFIEYAKDIARKNGYTCNVEKGAYGVRNITVGNVSRAKVIFTAHYDTCAILPFPNFITPKNIGIYLAYQTILSVGILFLAFGAGRCALLVCGLFRGGIADETLAFYAYYAAVLAVFYLMLFGPANKHTANDNTSGVTLLFDIMAALPEEQKDNAAFVFFDLEEMGLLGSSDFASKHKKDMKDKLLLNFDCVSDGKNIIIVLKKKAKKYAPFLEEAYKSNELFSVEILSKGVFYPSDQAVFNCGVGIAALKKSKRFNILYMDRIHTKKDVIFREENIDFLAKGSVKLVKSLVDHIN